MEIAIHNAPIDVVLTGRDGPPARSVGTELILILRQDVGEGSPAANVDNRTIRRPHREMSNSPGLKGDRLLKRDKGEAGKTVKCQG
jgi:hypothetical protein